MLRTLNLWNTKSRVVGGDVSPGLLRDDSPPRAPCVRYRRGVCPGLFYVVKASCVIVAKCADIAACLKQVPKVLDVVSKEIVVEHSVVVRVDAAL